MKIKNLLLAAVMLFSMLQVAHADDAFRLHRYDSWKVMKLPKDAIVFAGNSITDMHVWAEAFGNDPHIVNRGNSGGYSYEVLANVESWVRFKPAKVFIKIGTNDLGTNRTEQSIADNIAKTVDIIRRESPNTQIYLQSILPARDQAYKSPKTIQATNELIKAIAAKNENTTYVDLYSKMGGILKGAPYSLDNLHLEAYGYKLWVDAIKDYVGLPSSYPANTEKLQNTAGLGGAHGMRATYFSVLPIKSTDVLFFGDEMVKNGEWNELLRNQNVKNRGSWWGYGGNIATVGKFVDAAFSNKGKGVVRENPKKVLLYTGTEDINGNTDLTTVKNNYTALVKKLKSNVSSSTPIALVSLMPTANANSRIKQFNNWLKETAAADEQLTFIDIYSSLATSAGTANGSYFSGNYLYGAGYVVVARKLAEFIGDCTVITDQEAKDLKAMFEARTALNNTITAAASIKVGTGLGEYSKDAVKDLYAKLDAMKNLMAKEGATLEELKTMAAEANTILNNLKSKINTPTAENVTGKHFAICTPLRASLFAYAKDGGVYANPSNPGYASYRWTFEKRTDGAFNIKNVGANAYLDPSASYDKQVKLVATAPKAGWKVEYSNTLELYIIRSGSTCELNTTTKEGYPVYNWYGGNTNAQDRADAGCQWRFTDVTDIDIKEEPTPIKVVKGTAQEGAEEIVNGRTYTITNRQKNGTCYPLYADNEALAVGVANALAAKSYGNRAKFVAIKKGNNIFAFKNVATGYYLVWKGSNEGINNNAGLMEKYDSIYCCFKVASVTEVKNGKILVSKRANGTQDGTFIQNADGTWNKWGGPSLGFKDAFSNVYTLGDVTDGDKGEIVDEALNVEDESIVDWFTMRIGAGGLYVSNNGSKSYISLTTSKTTYADADLWRRTGNDTEGYTIINKEAGPDMVLAAPVKMLGTTGGESYPIMVNKNKIPEGYTALWLFAKSSNLGNNVEAYYMYEKGYTSNKVNNRDGKFAFWNGGADAGSTIRWEWAQRDISVNMATGSFTTSNGTWAKTWTSKAGEPKLVLDAGYNNMNVTASDETRIQAYVGKYSPQAYTLSAGANYSIAAYSFDFVMADNTAVKVIDASGKSYTTTKTPQPLACKGLKMPTASFTLSGANAGVILTNFKVSIRKAYIEPEPQVEIFPTRTSGDIPYRIPAIATAYDGTVVAVADYRFSRADIGSGRIDLHIRRSHDNGKTWDNILKPAVMTGDGNTAVGHQKAGYGDPCIVGDSESPRMIITSCSGTPGFFSGTRDHHQGWARWYSNDNGATWSEPQYIDEEFVYSKFDKSAYGPIRGWFIGSGKICQSTKTKVNKYRRLYLVGSSCRQGSNETANWVLYSDDFGETWEFLGGCDVSPMPNGDEPKAEELPDGSVLLSSRCNGGRRFNIFTFTDTKKAKGSWGEVAFSGQSNNGVTALNNACNGEVMLVPVTRKKDNQKMFLLLQSVPFGSGRSNVGIYYKSLKSLSDYRTPEAIAKNWDGHHQSSYISSAYSTMTWQKNNTIGFVYEEDTYGTNGGGYTIIYKNYSIEQITDSAFTYDPTVNGDSLTALGVKPIVDVVLTKGNFGTIVGQYKEEAESMVNAAYNTYIAAPSREGYERLNGAIANAPRVEISTGCYYTIRNHGRGSKNYVLNANSSKELGASTNAATDKAYWCFVPSADGANKYHLVSKAYAESMVGRTLAVEARTTLTAEKNEAGIFVITSNTQGLSKIQCANPTNASYSYLHLAGDNSRVVPWLASSPTENAPSFWYIEPTDIPTDIEFITTDANTKDASNDVIYDLSGRVVSAPQKGQIYIRGRKKFIK